MAQPLLGEYVDAVVDRDKDVISDLRDEIATLRVELIAANSRARQAEASAARSVARLRTQLSPLYSALQDVFGEMNSIAPGDPATTSPGSNGDAWESVKQRLQPRHREVIDVLLLQGMMTRRQISSAIKMNYTNCTNNIIGPLLRQGWLVEVGGKIQLKQL